MNFAPSRILESRHFFSHYAERFQRFTAPRHATLCADEGKHFILRPLFAFSAGKATPLLPFRVI